MIRVDILIGMSDLGLEMMECGDYWTDPWCWFLKRVYLRCCCETMTRTKKEGVRFKSRIGELNFAIAHYFRKLLQSIRRPWQRQSFKKVTSALPNPKSFDTMDKNPLTKPERSGDAISGHSNSPKSVVRVGVGVLVKDPKDPTRIFCGIRKGSHGAGKLALPG